MAIISMFIYIVASTFLGQILQILNDPSSDTITNVIQNLQNQGFSYTTTIPKGGDYLPMSISQTCDISTASCIVTFSLQINSSIYVTQTGQTLTGDPITYCSLSAPSDPSTILQIISQDQASNAFINLENLAGVSFEISLHTVSLQLLTL